MPAILEGYADPRWRRRWRRLREDGRFWTVVWTLAFICGLFVGWFLLGCHDPCNTHREHPDTHKARDGDDGRVALNDGYAGGLVPPQPGPPRRGSAAAPFSAPAAALWRVTAYDPGPCCCGPRACGVTASGRAAVGRLVAAPADVPFGTILDVPGYGLAVVADRGGAIQGRRLDVLFPTHAEAKAWGVRFLPVWFNEKKAANHAESGRRIPPA